jgi:hypothetical protein
VRLVLLLLASCASLQRTPLPADATDVVVVITGSTCPTYRLAIHQDGLVEYWADQTARVSGVGWLRVRAETVARLQHLAPSRPWKIVDVEGERWCRVYDAQGVGIAIHGSDGWTGECEVDPNRQTEILETLGVAPWLQLRPGDSCPVALERSHAPPPLKATG